MRRRNLWVSGRSFSQMKLKNAILATRYILSKTRLIAMGLMCAAVIGVPLMSKAFAAPGDFDHSLVSRGKAAVDIWGGDEVVKSIAVQPAGKMVVAGTTNLPRVQNAPPQSRERKTFAPADDKGRVISARCERWRDFL